MCGWSVEGCVCVGGVLRDMCVGVECEGHVCVGRVLRDVCGCGV